MHHDNLYRSSTYRSTDRTALVVLTGLLIILFVAVLSAVTVATREQGEMTGPRTITPTSVPAPRPTQ